MIMIKQVLVLNKLISSAVDSYKRVNKNIHSNFIYCAYISSYLIVGLHYLVKFISLTAHQPLMGYLMLMHTEEIESTIQVQILNKAICISLCADVHLGKA